MFRLPYGERVDPMEEKRQARENTISSVVTFAVLCAAIRIVAFGFDLMNMIKEPAAAKSGFSNLSNAVISSISEAEQGCVENCECFK